MPHLKCPYDYRLNKPFSTPILEIREESASVKTFIVDYNPIGEKVQIKPGQFVMVWVQGNDEIPMSVSYIFEDSKLGISVANVGETTNLLHQLKVGDLIGIRGPYGNNFNLKDNISIIVGGGIGTAAILPLIHYASKDEDKTNKYFCILGARTQTELVFQKELEAIAQNSNIQIDFCTDDGSFGFHGYTTSKMEQILNEPEVVDGKKSGKNIVVHTCGPEVMMKRIFEICEDHEIEIQASLERMMRCAFGVCGLCALEPTGLLVCHDGCIFGNEILRQTTDFGKFHRDFSGRPEKL